MSIEQRKHRRFSVRLAVRYTRAADFVADYLENISAGGVFIVGAHELPMMTVTEIELELPGRGNWRVTAKLVFKLTPEAAAAAHRKPGAGFEITGKPPGFDEALGGYLVRLEGRKELEILVGHVARAGAVGDAGYHALPLPPVDRVRSAAGRAVAAIVPAAELAAYREELRYTRVAVYGVAAADDMPDVLARLDSLLD